MTRTVQANPRRKLSSVIWWWTVTVATLVVLDDLMFGPFFWLISRLGGPVIAIGLIFAIYVPTQIYLVACGTRDHPGKVAAFFLRRLELERRNPRVGEIEKRVRDRAVGGISAALTALLIGGVLPALVLWRRGFDRPYVMRISVVTSTVYATEFALLHGFLPSLF